MTLRVMVFGTFDLLHAGHHYLLSEASKRGALTVIVARDSNVRKIKGFSPLQAETLRMRAIETAFPAADVRLGDRNDFLAPIAEIRPDVILLGYDQRLPPNVQEADLPCIVERIGAFHPEKYKSSLLRTRRKS